MGLEQDSEGPPLEAAEGPDRGACVPDPGGRASGVRGSDPRLPLGSRAPRGASIGPTRCPSEPPPDPLRRPFDAITCRNVMTYLDEPTRRRKVDRLYGQLRPAGPLGLGSSGSLGEVPPDLAHVRPAVHRAA